MILLAQYLATILNRRSRQRFQILNFQAIFIVILA